MRYITDERRIVWSASDLKAAAECEFAWLRAIDAKLGRVDPVEDPADATLERAGRLGEVHEQRVLEQYRREYGDAVREIAGVSSADAAGLAAAVEATAAALADPHAKVVYQAAFATDEFVGFADFLVRPSVPTPSPAGAAAPPGASGRVGPGAGTGAGAGSEAGAGWIVQDSKLARHARVTALMQLAAYADQLDRLGIPRSDTVQLLLGDGTVSSHSVDTLLPTYALRRDRLRALIADRRIETGAAGDAIAWGDDRGELQVVACGRCATCDLDVIAHRDLLLVAGMRPVQRQRLRDAGIDTIDALASASEPPPRMSADTFAMLRTQARLQLGSPAGIPAADAPEQAPIPTYEVVFPTALGALPRPDHGDLFFDFEGDPLYTEEPATMWGLDYLFGWVDTREQYSTLWAHDFAEERQALIDFLAFVKLRRQQHPGMHIYHYAPYEPTHLFEMARRYGVGEADVDRLLRDGVFVDLYPIVRRALRVGSRSYSIKKLEPLYMGVEVRTSDVQKGDDSIVKYVEARALAADGRDAEAKEILADLADYNRYDCVSTLRLRDWLVQRAIEAQLAPTIDPEPTEVVDAPSPEADALLRLAAARVDESGDPDDADAQALRLGAAAIDYYPRESKTFWVAHFLRLREPVSVWEDQRDVVVVDPAQSEVVDDWEQGPRSVQRRVRLRGALAPGTRLSERVRPFAVYELPAPFPAEPKPRWIHVARSVEVVEVLDDGAVIVESAVDGQTWDDLPIALTPTAPPSAGRQQQAIEAWADAVVGAAPAFPADPATDILRRRPPRLSPIPERVEGPDDVTAITRSILALDRSYLAVQGPPGTGKTYVGSHVIARLVKEHGFKIGVVAQSHAVVEHMLDRVVDAGVPKELVGKAPKDDTGAAQTFSVFPKNGMAAWTAEHTDTGYVIGGTAWDFSHEQRVARGSLDLLVIDEAGQFSLASTIAVSLAAPRLLLLGDPQQLPQVSQGTHPEPVDTSALGWVLDGAEVIPPELGFFLARTWRMHPAVAAPVSRLAYAGRLASHPSTALRSLEGVDPGVHAQPVRHRGNATQSPEEAARVVELVHGLIGRSWTGTEPGQDGTLPPRPLTQRDLIVVTPYNAQQVMVEEALAAAGYTDVPVGTVDKFQGQEAVVAIVSLAASSGRDAPRGLDFLLLQNRLNVAVSRAQYAAYVVYSPGLLDDLPRTPDGVTRLSAFARLVGAVPSLAEG